MAVDLDSHRMSHFHSNKDSPQCQPHHSLDGLGSGRILVRMQPFWVSPALQEVALHCQADC